MRELGEAVLQMKACSQRERLVARAAAENDAYQAADAAPAQYPTDCSRPDQPHDPPLRNDTCPGPSQLLLIGKTVPYRSCNASLGCQRVRFPFWLEV